MMNKKNELIARLQRETGKNYTSLQMLYAEYKFTHIKKKERHVIDLMRGIVYSDSPNEELLCQVLELLDQK